MKRITVFVCIVMLSLLMMGGAIVSSDEDQLEIGIAFGDSYHIYVTDPIHDRILKYDFDMNYLGVFFDKHSYCPEWKLENPISVATDWVQSFVLVTDSEKKRVYQINYDGTPYQIQCDANKDEVVEPWDISAVEIYDDIGNYALDRAGNKLLRYDPPSIDFDKSAIDCDSYCVLRFTIPRGHENKPASAGDGESEFNNPEGLMVDRRGYILVADTGNNRIQKFRRNGDFILEFGGSDDEFQLDHPVDLVPDWNEGSPNRYYIVDQGNNRVVITNEYGKYIDEIKPVDSNGQLLFERINSITVDNREHIWVVDSLKQTIHKFDSLDSENPLELIGSYENILSPISISVRDAIIPIKKWFAEVNNRTVKIKPFAQIIDNRTMIPVRWLMDNMFTQTEKNRQPHFEGSVAWDATEKKATLMIPQIDFGNGLVYQSRTIELWQDNPIARVNGEQIPISLSDPNVTTKIIDDRLFVPCRFVAEAFGAKVIWMPKDKIPKSRYGIVRILFPNYDNLKK